MRTPPHLETHPLGVSGTDPHRGPAPAATAMRLSDYLGQCDEFFSVAELHRSLADSTEISKVTVYRILEVLNGGGDLDMGLFRKRYNWFISNYFRPAGSRPSNVISKAFSATLHRLDQRWRAVAFGSRFIVARYTHFKVAASVGKCPRALTAPADSGVDTFDGVGRVDWHDPHEVTRMIRAPQSEPSI